MTGKIRAFFIILLQWTLTFDLAASEDIKINIIYASTMTAIGDTPHGSYAQLANLIQRERTTNKDTLLLFGGGSLGPSALSSLDRGAHIIDLLNSIEPDVYGVGKREFSYYEDELSLRAFEAAFPMVISNVIDPIVDGNLDGLHDSIIIEKLGVRIGIVSVVAESVKNEYGLKRATVLPVTISLERIAKHLREQNVSVIILMYSSALDYVDTALSNGIIDLALRKDEHFDLARSNKIDHHEANLILTDPHSVFKISLNIADDNPPKFDFETLSLLAFDNDKTVAEQERRYQFRVKRLMQREFTKLNVPFNTLRANVRSRETIIGNMLTDAMKEYTGAQIALLNGGNIRGENTYPAGTRITHQIVSDILPYRNHISVIELSGQQLYAVMEHAVSAIDESKGRYLQVSGLSVIYDPKKAIGSRIVELKVENRAVHPRDKFKVAITDYLINGGDDFEMLTRVPRIHFDNRKGALLSEVFVAYLSQRPALSPQLEQRIVSFSQ